jgi:hypothetical protein
MTTMSPSICAPQKNNLILKQYDRLEQRIRYQLSRSIDRYKKDKNMVRCL